MPQRKKGRADANDAMKQATVLCACVAVSLGCATHSRLAAQTCAPSESLPRGMTQAQIRRSLGAPAVVGIPRASVLGPLRVVIGAPADSPDVLWLYPADGAQQNAWTVLTFYDHGLADARCAHAWFQAEHDVAEPRDVVDAIRDP